MTGTVGVGVTAEVGVGVTGGLSHEFVGLAVLRGVGVPVAKSTLLSSVSLQPLPLRSAAVVLFRRGAASPSKKLALP